MNCFKYNRHLGQLRLFDLKMPRASHSAIFKSNNLNILGVYLALIPSLETKSRFNSLSGLPRQMWFQVFSEIHSWGWGSRKFEMFWQNAFGVAILFWRSFCVCVSSINSWRRKDGNTDWKPRKVWQSGKPNVTTGNLFSRIKFSVLVTPTSVSLLSARIFLLQKIGETVAVCFCYSSL